ncbi:60S ribosomal protein L12-like [Penaeus japonicus]|uniref:60S ribosomal protein L12-like n=1 Tax=Penaeus japonicus TaxID=27405 RepID=UPI001C717134|nr:60S ribosomal protein L12-like [Penaeus japonicus]
MPPEFDPEEIHIVTVRCQGQKLPPVNILASKIGPLKLNPKMVCQQISEVTQDWPGQKITVRLTVQNRQCKAEVVPSAACYIIKALKQKQCVKSANGYRGNLTFDEIIRIARLMQCRSEAKTFDGTVKMILGTAQSVNCQVDGKPPHDIIDGIRDGSIFVPLE